MAKNIINFLFLVSLGVNSSKIDGKLKISLLSGKENLNIFVKFKDTSAHQLINSAVGFPLANMTVTHLVEELKFHSVSSQSKVVKQLQSELSINGESIESFWITNELFIRGTDSKIVEKLESFPDVDEIHEENIISLEAFASTQQESTRANGNEWNIVRVKAHEVWNKGFNGRNIVVANIDTGVRVSHEALRGNYREQYGWFDPVKMEKTPSDLSGHAGSNGIGMAPGILWISCRACNTILCSESALKSCGQWVLCPTKWDGSEPDCSKAPNIVSNSWGNYRGGNPYYNSVIQAWKAANIIPVFSIGNAGPDCETVRSPGDQSVISVGSVDSSDMISYFSSVGPSMDGKIKPEVTAPGQNVRSAWIDDDSSYSSKSGTSMSCPHVAGAVALLLSKNPNLKYEDVFRIITEKADKNVPNGRKTCGGIPSTKIPNHQYGYGILNAARMIEAA